MKINLLKIFKHLCSFSWEQFGKFHIFIFEETKERDKEKDWVKILCFFFVYHRISSIICCLFFTIDTITLFRSYGRPCFWCCFYRCRFIAWYNTVCICPGNNTINGPHRTCSTISSTLRSRVIQVFFYVSLQKFLKSKLYVQKSIVSIW